jgi:hypothetical protein
LLPRRNKTALQSNPQLNRIQGSNHFVEERLIMSSIVKRVLFSVLGVAVMLAWWTIRGDSGSNTKVQKSIPAKVWDGGGGTISVELETTVAGKMSIGFEERVEKDARSLQTEEHVAPGKHLWSVEVPTNAGGYIEFDAEAPKVGDKMSWVVRHNGNQIAHDDMTLQEELKPGYAFFLQEHYHDYSKPDVQDDD